MRVRLIPGLVLAAVFYGVTPLDAQESRAELIQEARNEFDTQAKLASLGRAADPTSAPLDSLWAVAVYDLAAVLMDENEPALADVWLRWVARHGEWPIDRSWYAPAVVQAYDNAVPTATEGLSGPAVSTTWRWPADLDVEDDGILVVESSDPSVPVAVSVEGRPTIFAGGAQSLPAGTYELIAAAEGYDTVPATREVLPGVTTVLQFDLPPALPAAVRNIVAGSLVRIRFIRGGQQVCTNGVIATPDGLVLTSLGPLQGVGGLEVVTGLDAYGGVTIAASDPNRDLAVLRFGGQGLPVLPSATNVAVDQYVWSVHHPSCDTGASSSRSRLAGWPAPPTPAPLGVSLPSQALGAPVVDRGGSLLGVVVAPDRVVSVAGAQELLDEAVEELVADEQVVGGGGGGFPFVWVGAGAAVVGAAILFGGGGGGGNGGGDEPPTTGGIRVTFPGNSP